MIILLFSACSEAEESYTVEKNVNIGQRGST